MLSPKQKESVVRAYFTQTGAEEAPECLSCHREWEIRQSVLPALGLQLEVRCPSCSEAFSWSQPQPVREWKELHLRYFAERYLTEQLVRCPYDDCYVSYAEFEGGVVQFNCPLCNRRGQIVVETHPSRDDPALSDRNRL